MTNKKKQVTNLTGQRFGTRIVTGSRRRESDDRVLYEVKCDCGKTSAVTKDRLIGKYAVSCRSCSAKLTMSKRDKSKCLTGKHLPPYVTYLYFDEDRIPRYVGCGGQRRPFATKCGGKKRPYPKPKDKSLILILKRFETREEAERHEIYMIHVIGREIDGTGPLKNISPGGNVMDATTQQKIKETLSGTTLSIEHRRRIGLNNKGRKDSAETRRKKKLAKQGVPNSRQHRVSNSKYEYVVIDPNGNREFVPLLRDYALVHGLSCKALTHCSIGNQLHHKGYRVERYAKGEWCHSINGNLNC